MNETWVILLISGGLPAAITVLGPVISKRIQARVEARKLVTAERKTDAEVGHDLRDELRQMIDRLQKRVDDLEEAERECQEDRLRLRADLGTANGRIAVLEERVRQGSGGQQQSRGIA